MIVSNWGVASLVMPVAIAIPLAVAFGIIPMLPLVIIFTSGFGIK